MSVLDEWNTRKTLLDESLHILSDGRVRTTQQLVYDLAKIGVKASDHLVNTVLLSEGRHYVKHEYDREHHRYSIIQDETSTVRANGNHSHKTTTEMSNNVLRAEYMGPDLQYICRIGDSTGSAFFDVELFGSSIVIKLNKNHPFTHQVIRALQAGDDHGTDEELRDQLFEAQEVIETLLISWALYENQQPEGARRIKVHEYRLDWGRVIRALLLDEFEQSEG